MMLLPGGVQTDMMLQTECMLDTVECSGSTHANRAQTLTHIQMLDKLSRLTCMMLNCAPWHTMIANSMGVEWANSTTLNYIFNDRST
jgi:hypothetical protein